MQESYYDKHREQMRTYQKAYYEAHKEQKKEYHKKWYQENKHLYNERKDSSASSYWKKVLYSVWNNFTDEVVIIDGNNVECAKAMGVSNNSFYTLVSKASRGKMKKWTIEKKMLRGETV